MSNQGKQFAWSADAFIIIFKVDDNKYKLIENVALCFFGNMITAHEIQMNVMSSVTSKQIQITILDD